MHSWYQFRETHYGDLSLSVHDRINDLHRRADRLASAVAESALDSGCTDQTKASYAKLGPRQVKAWDMVAEAHGWNAVSDTPALLAEAERYERADVSYKIEYQGWEDLSKSPVVVVTEAPTGRVDEMIATLDAQPDVSDGIDPRTWRHVYDSGLVQVADVIRAYGYLFAEAPKPYATSAAGWARIQYLNSLRDDLDRFPTTELEDEYDRLLGERYDPDGRHNLREPQHEAKPRTLGEMTPAERDAAVKRAAGQLQAELQASAGHIGKVMDDFEAEPEDDRSETTFGDYLDERPSDEPEGCTSEDPNHPGLTCHLVADDHTDHFAMGHRW